MVTRSGPQAKERVASCETVVHESRGVPPQATPGMLAGFYNDMLKRASFFFVHQVSNDAGQKTSTSGKAGIDKYIQETWAKHEGDKGVTINDIEAVRAFWWLLNDDQVTKVQQMTAAALEKVSSTQVIRKASTDSDGKGSRSKKAKVSDDARRDTCKANIMKLFS